MEPKESVEDAMPIFYVGQHEAKRSLPITVEVLQQAQNSNVRAPILSVGTLLTCATVRHVDYAYYDSPFSLSCPRSPFFIPLTPSILQRRTSPAGRYPADRLSPYIFRYAALPRWYHIAIGDGRERMDRLVFAGPVDRRCFPAGFAIGNSICGFLQRSKRHDPWP